MKTNNNKLDMLNLLRLIAFLLVFMLHVKIFMPVQWNDGVSNVAWPLYTPAWGGVWIFFVLSGFGIGKGFYSGKYEFSFNGVCRYYIGRIIKILPMYWFYILVVAVFIKPNILFPSLTNYKQLLSLLFLNYHGEFLNIEYGLAWYLTTLFRLYLIAPLWFFIIRDKSSNNNKKIVKIIIFVLIVGFISRFIAKYYIGISGEGWEIIYTPFYFNLDLFLAGFTLANLNGKHINDNLKSILKATSLVTLVLLIVYNSYIYYYGTYFNGTTKYISYMDIYRYVLPSVYLVVTCLYIFAFNCTNSIQYAQLNKSNILKNPIRIIDYFPRIQLSMYLFHSSVCETIQRHYVEEEYLNILRVYVFYKNFSIGCLFTIVCFFVTMLWAIITSKLINGINLNKINYLYQIDFKSEIKKLKR